MARKNPVSAEKIEEGKRIRALRDSLKVARTVFAPMCGLSNHMLDAKEAGRVPFRPEEIAHVKTAVAAHLAACARAFKETFS